jgi:ABC-type branched-subunit amino acid transport system substrate-binding protein
MRNAPTHVARRRAARLLPVGVAALALVVSACGSRLAGTQLALAQGVGANGSNNTNTNAAANAAANGSASTPGSSGSTGTAASTGTTGSGATGASAAGAHPGSTGSAAGTPAAAAAAACNASNNGGATDKGVTANSITIGNIASFTGVAPGLTQSAQQAMQAWAAYVNSQGGICGRSIKVLPFDDQNDSGQNFAGASQFCSSAFAMVGNASGFDDGGANAVNSCGIPDLQAEVSTVAAGNTADVFGASPGLAHYFQTGPALYLKSKFPDAVTKAAMIYLNVPATADNATHEVAAYKSVGFNYLYVNAVTPTDPNYSPDVLKMQQDGVQYVTEYSDVSSAERLLQAMQQQNYTPQVVDWFSEEYTPGFITATTPASNGNLVLMATAAYEEASSNPGMQLMLSWLNRVAPGFTHDIFAIFAWSAGMAFLQAATAVGPHLTRAALIAQIQGIHAWTGGGLQPASDIGGKKPSPCFSYFQIQGNAFQRAYPSGANTTDCTGPLFSF